MALGSRSLLPVLTVGALSFVLSACPDDETKPDAGGVAADAAVFPDASAPDAPAPDARADAGVPDMGGGMDADAGVSGPQAITLLHTNDEHSHLFGFGPEIDDFPTPAMPGSGIEGGIKRRARALENLRTEARARGDAVAIVSAGDTMMGTLLHLGDVIAGVDYNVLTLLQYDVITLGNHEFDFGAGTLAGAVSEGGINLVSMMTTTLGIPVVTSNIRFNMSETGDDALAAFYRSAPANGFPLRRTHVQRFGNVRVGFVGLMGLDAALVAPFKSPVRFSTKTNGTACNGDEDCPGTFCAPPASDGAATMGECAVTTNDADPRNFEALVADAASAVAELRAQGVDLVVALCHVGVNEQEVAMIRATGALPAQPVSEEILLALGVNGALGASSQRGIDVIIGGHSHTVLDQPLSIPNPMVTGHSTVIVQAGDYGRWLGQLRVTTPGGGAPWTVDTANTRLLKIDDTVSAAGLSPITDQALDLVIGTLMDGLEAQSISVAGDQRIFPGEQCDGAFLPNGGNCLGLVPQATGGTVTCENNRQLNLSACTFGSTTCGNGTLETGELCDGTAFGGATCQSLGYDGGNLACHPNCAPSFAGCLPFFPSLIEAALNFQQFGSPIRNDPTERGDLFYYRLGHTSFDVAKGAPNREGNLMNLVTDAERWALNDLVDTASGEDPVRVVINANGVLRDDLKAGSTGDLSMADLFRVVPLGVSPAEGTPNYPLVDFYLTAVELKAALEVGVNQGAFADSFWLGVSGARITYDPTLAPFDPANPLASGRITKVELADLFTQPWDDSSFETTPVYDASLGAGLAAYPDPARLIRAGTSLYIALFAEALGVCPRRQDGSQVEECRSCTTNAECTALGTTCDVGAGHCAGGNPAAFRVRSTTPLGNSGLFQEVKEFLALIHFVRNLSDGKGGNRGELPLEYSNQVPRRLCCTGNACQTDQVCD